MLVQHKLIFKSLSSFNAYIYIYTTVYTNLIIQTGPSLSPLTYNALCYRWLQLI